MHANIIVCNAVVHARLLSAAGMYNTDACDATCRCILNAELMHGADMELVEKAERVVRALNDEHALATS